MQAFESITEMGHEQVVFCHDKATGLKAIIAIHDTTLGPALGGTRMWDYANTDAALFDVSDINNLRLFDFADEPLFTSTGTT